MPQVRQRVGCAAGRGAGRYGAGVGGVSRRLDRAARSACLCRVGLGWGVPVWGDGLGVRSLLRRYDLSAWKPPTPNPSPQTGGPTLCDNDRVTAEEQVLRVPQDAVTSAPPD